MNLKLDWARKLRAPLSDGNVCTPHAKLDAVPAQHVDAFSRIRTNDSSGLLCKALLAYSHLLGAADNLAVIVEGAANTQVFVSVKWKEIR